MDFLSATSPCSLAYVYEEQFVATHAFSLFFFGYLFKHSVSLSLTFALSSLLLLFVLRFDLPTCRWPLVSSCLWRTQGPQEIRRPSPCCSLLLCICSFAGDFFQCHCFPFNDVSVPHENVKAPNWTGIAASENSRRIIKKIGGKCVKATEKRKGRRGTRTQRREGKQNANNAYNKRKGAVSKEHRTRQQQRKKDQDRAATASHRRRNKKKVMENERQKTKSQGREKKGAHHTLLMTDGGSAGPSS